MTSSLALNHAVDGDAEVVENDSAETFGMGSEDEFVSRFSSRLMVVAQRHLSRYLRHKVEPEDISQSVFRSFFRRQRQGEFEFRDWNGVWGLLVRLAICKCRNRMTYLQAQRRDVRKERSLNSQEQTDTATTFDPIDAHPNPVEQAAVGEVLESFLQDLNADDRLIFAGHLAGYRSPAISVQVGCSEQTVRRRLQQMEYKLRSRLSDWESVEQDGLAN